MFFCVFCGVLSGLVCAVGLSSEGDRKATPIKNHTMKKRTAGRGR